MKQTTETTITAFVLWCKYLGLDPKKGDSLKAFKNR
jgi:hypothetical protein